MSLVPLYINDDNFTKLTQSENTSLPISEHVSRKILTTLSPDNRLLQIPEIGEFDNKRVDKILEQYDLETLLRFPGILIECFLYKNITKEQLNKYAFIMTSIEGYEGYSERIKITLGENYASEVHLDGEHNITLYFEDIALANIGLDGNFVKQIQSSRICNVENNNKYQSNKDFNNFFIEAFNWKKVLVKIAEKCIVRSGAKEIFIQAALSSCFPQVRDQGNIGEWGYEIYDQTALDLGYKFDGYGRYVKEL